MQLRALQGPFDEQTPAVQPMAHPHGEPYFCLRLQRLKPAGIAVKQPAATWAPAVDAQAAQGPASGGSSSAAAMPPTWLLSSWQWA